MLGSKSSVAPASGLTQWTGPYNLRTHKRRSCPRKHPDERGLPSRLFSLPSGLRSASRATSCPRLRGYMSNRPRISAPPFYLAIPIFLITVFLPVRCIAQGFPPISPDELKMTSEPQAPGAPAVILFREVNRDDNGLTTHEDNYVRIKILTEEGREHANEYVSLSQAGRDHGEFLGRLYASRKAVATRNQGRAWFLGSPVSVADPDE